MILFCKQKTAYEMRICDWISSVCYSDLLSQFWFSQFAATGLALTGLAFTGFAPTGPLPVGCVYSEFFICPYGLHMDLTRSEERRVGTEWCSKCRSRWSPYH